MGWLRRLGGWVGNALKTVFTWAFELPVLGIAAGAGLLLYGINHDEPITSWLGVAALATGVFGWITTIPMPPIPTAAGAGAPFLRGIADWMSRLF